MRNLWALLVALMLAVPAAAQNARDGRLIITVADQTGAVVPGATVTLTFQDVPNAPAIPPATSSAQGVATFQTLAQGRYTVRTEFAGFEISTVRDVRVRAGENRQSVTLRLANLQDSITVGRDAATSASDRGPTFGTVLTREQIDALSEDPEEAQRQLQELAGPGAVIRVDSFEGSALPPKSQIRMIRISRDQFAAENHSAGGLTIDIVTQPGIGPIRGQVNTRLRDGSMTGRSPFVEKKGPERSQDYNLNLSGSLIQGRTSFSLGIGGNSSFDTPNLNATNLDGTRSDIQALSGDVLAVGQGSLYPALHRLEQQGWIQAEWRDSDLGRAAKFYALTRHGSKQLELELQSWDRLSGAVRLVIQKA